MCTQSFSKGMTLKPIESWQWSHSRPLFFSSGMSIYQIILSFIVNYKVKKKTKQTYNQNKYYLIIISSIALQINEILVIIQGIQHNFIIHMKFNKIIFLTYGSYLFNFIAIIVIFVLLYRRRREKKEEKQTISPSGQGIHQIDKVLPSIDTKDMTIIPDTGVQPIIHVNSQDKVLQTIKKDQETKEQIYPEENKQKEGQEQIKTMQEKPVYINDSFNLPMRRDQLQKTFEQSKDKIILKQKEERILALAEQIDLQTDRNTLLQLQNINLKTKLQLTQAQLQKSKIQGKSPSPSHQPIKSQYRQQQILNLKNQLQFCQQKLTQYVRNDAQLTGRISDYERTYSVVMMHPEYQRLKELNNEYKNTINLLQRHLLERSSHENSRSAGINLSFGDF